MNPLPSADDVPDASFAAQAHELYGADLYYFLLSRLRNEQDAKDVVQEIYLRLLRLGSGELIRDPHAYVYFVASQVLAQFRMRANLNPLVYDSALMLHRDAELAGTSRDPVADSWLTLSEAEALLDALPATHRKVFMLRKLDGLSWIQIGQKLGISVHTVKKYLYEANARISIMRREQE